MRSSFIGWGFIVVAGMVLGGCVTLTNPSYLKSLEKEVQVLRVQNEALKKERGKLREEKEKLKVMTKTTASKLEEIQRNLEAERASRKVLAEKVKTLSRELEEVTKKIATPVIIKPVPPVKKVEKVDVEKVKKAQKALKLAGFDPGPVDGKIGRKTREALKNFQEAHQLNPTGNLDEATWKELEQYLILK